MSKTKIYQTRKIMHHATQALGKGRTIRLGLALLMLGSVCVPVLQEVAQQQRYKLDSSTIRLVGNTNTNLAKKLSFDAQNNQWQFNKDGIKADPSTMNNPADIAAALRAQVGGSGKKDDSLYSVNMPVSGKKGVTYYDNNTNLSFSIVPQFAVQDGQARHGKLIYPFSDDAKLVYTAMNNGMKEDIVLSHNIGDTLIFRYKLDLPSTLQAKIRSDGSLGIYSPDPTLFGDMSFGTNVDRAKIESARQTAAKDHLLFALPAPVIKQTGNEQVKATGEFQLEGSELILYANHMNSVTYPASVDPSVVVTSTSDFTAGNNEGNIDFANGQINRGALTGGSIGSWNDTASLNSGREEPSTFVYNGYIYALGGVSSGGTFLNTTEYALVNSNGTVGTWTPTTNLPLGIARMGSVAYNGYVYIFGGVDSSNYYNTAYYAPLNTNGTIGTWISTTAIPAAVMSPKALAYNGYVYIMGGINSAGTRSNAVSYTQLNGNGTIGTWSSTSAFATARSSFGAVINNGYMYIAGGSTASGVVNDVQYAPINSSGTLGSWTATTSFTTARSSLGMMVSAGYLYIAGGFASSGQTDTQYAQINANGTVGSWRASSSLPIYRYNQGVGVWGGNLYQVGGYQSGYSTSVQYSKIDAAGITTGYTTSTALPAETAKGKTYSSRVGHTTVVYNGYIYVLGGMTNSPASYYYNSVVYAPINSNGSIGTWATTTAFTNARAGHTSFAYNGYMYILGGWNGTTYYNDVQYASISGTGTLGTWATTTAFTNARAEHATQMYNGYVYVMGGWNGTTYYNDVQYATISGTGTLGTWATTTAFTNARAGLTMEVNGGYAYMIFGHNGSTYYNDIQYAPINGNGTIGTWTATNGDGFGLADHVSFVHKGYLYTASGYDGGSSHIEVRYAPINANGTIGTWASNQAIQNIRSQQAGAVYNGVFYLIGGTDGASYYGDTSYTTINNGGTGQFTTINTVSGLPAVRQKLKTVVYNGYIYAIGGSTSSGLSPTSTVYYAQLTSDGVPPSSWNTTTGLPYLAEGFQALAYNGYMYYFGGTGGNGVTTNSVYYAQINTGGTLGTWTATTTMTGTMYGLYNFGAVAYNGYLYAVGGVDEDSFGLLYNNITQYAPINSNGTLGTWASTNSPGILYEHEVVVANGYMYAVGGSNSTSSSSPINTVKYAKINTGGTLGTWTNTSLMQSSRKDFQAVAYNGYLYAIAGYVNGSSTSLEAAPLLAGGGVGTWSNKGDLASSNEYFAATVVRGNLFVIGGTNGVTTYQSVEYGSLASIARAAKYSKLIDMGSTVSLSGFTYNGTVPNGGASIMFRSAGTDGIFNTAASITTLSGSGTGVVCGTGGGGGGSRYVWLSVTLDDTQSGAVFADSVGPNNANVTDLTVNYAGGGQHPTPQQRLRGGKFFQTEVLQPLDTCGP